MKKKILVLSICLLVWQGMAVLGCVKVYAKSAPLHIVTTIAPVYEWIMEILGEEASHANVTMLLDDGVDMHSFQPSVKDIVEISSCDLFICVGGESDAWVKDALSEARNDHMVVLNLLELLGEDAREEERTEGMQEPVKAAEETDGLKGAENPAVLFASAEAENEYDEHVWLSLKNAKLFCEKISETLQELDPEHAQSYRKQEAAYREKLILLDQEYENTVQSGAHHTLVFASRFPFRYLVEDYELRYFAAFAGCEAETEASFDTIIFLAEKADELQVPVILTIEGDDPKIAETVRDNTKNREQQILVMDSMQSTTSEDLKNGSTYLSIMEENLAVLKAALG